MVRTLVVLAMAAAASGCMRSRDVQTDLKLVDVRTGWYDAGVVNGSQNKLVPSVTLKLQNVSQDSIRSVQINAIFRRVNEQEAWGDHLAVGVDRDGLEAGATGREIVLRSRLGYTGDEPRLQMLQNKEFVDAKVEIFGKHGSRQWAKMGEFVIDRQLLTE